MKNSSAWMVRELFPKLVDVVPGTIHFQLPLYGYPADRVIRFFRHISFTTFENRKGVMEDGYICVSQVYNNDPALRDYIIWYSVGTISSTCPERGYLRKPIRFSQS